MSDYHIVMGTCPEPVEGVLINTPPEHVEGVLMDTHPQYLVDVLKDLYSQLFFSVGLFSSGEYQIRHSRGVRYGRTFIRRRTLLTFTTSYEMACFLTGRQFFIPLVYLCICAAKPTMGPLSTSEDFFICYSSSPKYKNVRILRIFRPICTEIGPHRVSCEAHRYLRSVVRRLAKERIRAREAAKEARLLHGF